MKSEHNGFATPTDAECLLEDLIAIALFGLQDPLRDNIQESVKKCKMAGI